MDTDTETATISYRIEWVRELLARVVEAADRAIVVRGRELQQTHEGVRLYRAGAAGRVENTPPECAVTNCPRHAKLHLHLRHLRRCWIRHLLDAKKI